MSANKKAKTTTNSRYDEINGKYMLLVEATEPGEPLAYRFNLNGAPDCLKRQLATAGKHAFEHVYLSDGADGADGLVAEGDDEDDDSQTISDYFLAKSIPDNKFVVPFNGSIDFLVHLASV